MEFENSNNKKKRTDLNSIVYGKIPPQARDLEEAVLGAVLINKNALNEVIELLKPECFYVEAHQKIFKAMLSLYRKSNPVDIPLVIEELRFKEDLESVGGPYYVIKLTNAVVSAANIVHHARVIIQKYIQREIIRLCGESISDAFDDTTDVFDLLDLLTNQLRDVNSEIQEKKQISIPTVSIDVIKSLHEKAHNARDNIIDPNEVYTMLPEWDRINGSLFPGLFVIAGRPGMGKGVILTEMVCRMGKKHEVGVINGEMTNKQLLIRIGCNLKQIDNELWKRDGINISDEDLKLVYESMQDAQTLKLRIDDSVYIHRICAKIRMWVEKYGVKIILIDFLGLLKVPDEYGKYMTDTQKLNYIMDALRCLAKELNIPIFIFCQLNRELYKRGGSKEPNLADLKGSGNIEEFAYQISFLHRPEYYDIFEDDLGESTKGLIYHIIAKHREGMLGRLKYKFSPQFSKIDKWDFQPIVGWKPSPTIGF